MAGIRGHRVALSLPRRWIVDLMRQCQGMPIVTAVRPMHLGPLVEARDAIADPPTWTTILLKAYALVCARTPILRQSYQSFPWAHLYQNPEVIASLAVNRDYFGEPAVFFELLRTPEQRSLLELHIHLGRLRTEPVETIRTFARLIRYTRYSRPIRRLVWALGMHLSGRHRAKTVGTFGLSAIGATGASLTNLVSPTATSLTFGPISRQGEVEVRLSFDHRVLDGVTAARALHELEAVLLNELAEELQKLRSAPLA